MRALAPIVFLLVSAAASAQYAGESTPPSAPRADFAALDRNKDGFLSKYEASADREIGKRFAAFDRDQDGRLSETEYALAVDDNQRRILSDAALTVRVKAALLAEKGIPSMSISVDTYEAQVQLSGFVRSPDMVSHAGRITAGVAGVRTVHNNIAVK